MQFRKNFYIGETCRTLAARCREHLAKKDGPVFDHFVKRHNTIPSKEHVCIKVLSSGFVNTLHRTAREQQVIASLQPELNTQHGVIH